MNINEWLMQAPDESEISTNKDGSQYLDIRLVEDKLTELTDNNWGVENFKFKILSIEDKVLFSGSAEVVVYFDSRCRRITGAFTKSISDYENNIDFEATCLSECIKNAAKRLGNKFGRMLNNEPEPFKEKPKVKMNPDKRIRLDYAAAVARKDESKVKILEGIYDFTLKIE